MHKTLELLDNPDAINGEGDGSWIDSMTITELQKLHLARAFVMNPEVLVLQRPVDDFCGEGIRLTTAAFRQHVDNRGFCQPEVDVSRRRPRTIFMTLTRHEPHAARVDCTLVLSGGSVSLFKGEVDFTGAPVSKHK